MPNEKQPNETESGISPINYPSISEVQMTSSFPSSEENWYYAVCEEEYVAEIWVGHNCIIWIHKECVGFTNMTNKFLFYTMLLNCTVH